MKELILYHGSNAIIEMPDITKGKTNNDYGRGFYCTQDIELAKEWACSNENQNGYVNKYTLDLSDCKILNLSNKKFNVLNWLAILLENRKVRFSTPLSKTSNKYIIDHFLPKYDNYDVIIGYRADDSYFSYARAFVSNEISVEQLKRALVLGNLGEQIVIKSEKAFSKIKFIESNTVESKIYYSKRTKRDDDARKSFLKELENIDLNGLFVRDIIRQEIRNDDPRL